MTIISGVRIAAYILLLLAMSCAASAQSNLWRPITEADRKANSPKVTSGAPAEYLFWDETIQQSESVVEKVAYVRAKIFDQRGIDRLSTIRVEYGTPYKLTKFEARIVQPDGLVIDLPRTESISLNVEKTEQTRMRSEAFVMPKLQVGSIIDYRIAMRGDGMIKDWRLVLQREFPAQEITYRFRGDIRTETLKLMRLGSADFESFTDKGWTIIRAKNIEPMPDEPNLPPEWNYLPSLLLYYENEPTITPEKYWDRFGKNFHWFFEGVDSNSEITKRAQQIVEGATTDEEKINRLLIFCRSKIKNLSFDPELDPQLLQKAIERNDGPSQVLKKGEGTDHCIDRLFASLAEAVGLEVRLVFTGDRRTFFFTKSFPHSSLVRYMGLAIKSGHGWHLCNPGMLYVPNSRLHWYSEGQEAMLIDRHSYAWTTLPISRPSFNKIARKARFAIGTDGSLEGRITISLYGQLGEKFRSANYRRSPEELKLYARNQLFQTFGEMEATDASVRNMNSQTEPVEIDYLVRVARYAQASGKRLIFEPSFFAHTAQPMFQAADRKAPIYFELLKSQVDEIEFEIPLGYEIESLLPETQINDDPGVARLAYKTSYDPETRTMKYDRLLTMGENGQLLYPILEYPRVKTAFDRIALADKSVISLRKK